MSTGTSAPDGRQAANGAQQAAQELAGQAQEKAQQAAGQARGKLRMQVDQRSSQVAARVEEQASDLRSVSQTLREQGKSGPATVADRLAEYAERAGGYLRDKDSDAMLADAEELGRRQPWAVGAGALALGFAASRVLKASSSKRYSGRAPSPQPDAPAAAERSPATTPAPFTAPATTPAPTPAAPLGTTGA